MWILIKWGKSQNNNLWKQASIFLKSVNGALMNHYKTWNELAAWMSEWGCRLLLVKSICTWMLSSALWVQCIMVVKVSVVMRPPRKCWTLRLRTAIPERENTHEQNHCKSTKLKFFRKRQKFLHCCLLCYTSHYVALWRSQSRDTKRGETVSSQTVSSPLPHHRQPPSSPNRMECILRGDVAEQWGNTEEPQSLSVSTPSNAELFTQATRVFPE